MTARLAAKDLAVCLDSNSGNGCAAQPKAIARTVVVAALCYGKQGVFVYPHGGPDRKALLALIKWELRNALKIRFGDVLAVFKRNRLFGDYYVHRAVENGVFAGRCPAVFVCLTAYGKSAVGQ